MTSTQPRSVAELSAEVLALGARLHQVGVELRAAQVPVPAPAPVRPVPPRPVPPPAPRPPVHAGPRPPVPPGPRPAAGPRPPFPAGLRPPFPPPAPPRPPWWQREGAASRVLAVAGSALTLLGVVLLLVLAVQRGYLGPVPRVVGGAVLAAVLVGLGARVRGRAGGRVGAVALAGTGFAGLHLDVVAATAGYGWLPVAAGLALSLLVAAAGVALADRWRTEALALVAVGGAAVLGPVVAGRVALLSVAFLLVLQAAALPSALRRGWTVLPALAALPPVLLALVAAAATGAADLPVAQAVGAAAATTLVGLAAALSTLRVRPADPLAVPALLLAALPTLVVSLAVARPTGAIVSGGLGAVLLVVLLAVRWLGPRGRVAVGAAAALAVVTAGLLALDGAGRPALLLGEALVLLAVAHRARSLALLRAATGFAVLGGLGALAAVPPVALAVAGRAAAQLGVGSLAVAVLLGVTALALAAEVRFSGQVADLRPVWGLAGVVALYGLTGALVSAGVLALGADGFVLGHTAATVSATVLALALLAVGLRRGGTAVAARVGGLLLAGLAVAKLLLFDLAALDGVYRVVAFLVVGLLLLAAGTRYARLLGTAAQDAARTAPPTGQ